MTDKYLLSLFIGATYELEIETDCILNASTGLAI